MDSKSQGINSFFFNPPADYCQSNYPGLTDAIYIVFFRSDDPSIKSNYVLDVMRGAGFSNLKLVSDSHEFYDIKFSVGESHADLSLVSLENPYFDKESEEYQTFIDNEVKCNGKAVLNCAIRVPIDLDKSSFSCKSQGAKRGITYLSELNVVFKFRNSMVSELQHALLLTNLKIGVVFKDANGDFRLMADPDYDMTIEASDESGEGPSGSAAASLKFSQISKMPPIYYRGVLKFSTFYCTNHPAADKYSVNCETGMNDIDQPGGTFEVLND